MYEPIKITVMDSVENYKTHEIVFWPMHGDDCIATLHSHYPSYKFISAVLQRVYAPILQSSKTIWIPTMERNSGNNLDMPHITY